MSSSSSPALDDALISKLKLMGLDDKNAMDFSKNAERSKDLIQFFDTNKAFDADLRVRKMIFNIYQTLKEYQHREVIVQWLVQARIQTSAQVTAAIKFLSATKQGESLCVEKLATACGADVKVLPSDITSAVAAVLAKHKDDILQQRYKYNAGQILSALKNSEGNVRWAEGASVKEEVDAQLLSMLGPKTEQDTITTSTKAPSSQKTPAHVSASAQPPTAEESHLTADFRQVGKGMQPCCIKDVPAHVGQSVLIRGWAHRVRHQSKISFAVLRDGSGGFVQVVFPWRVPPFHRETSLAIVGKVIHEVKAQGENAWQLPYEIQVEQWAIIGPSDGEIENLVTAESAPDVLFDQRHLVLRGNGTAAVMAVRASLLRAFREFFHYRSVLEVTPPTMVQTQCEGGATLFELGFYDEKAYLTQSSQLYLETCVPSLGNVYCILSSYRAEKSKTRRHLSEFTHVEAELGNITFEDLLTFLEEMMVDVMQRVFKDVGHLIAQEHKSALCSPDANPNLPESWSIMPTRPFARINYNDAIALLNKHNILNAETNAPYVLGDDIPDKAEREMVTIVGKPILLMRFPAAMKAFYMSRCDEDRTLTESVDVLMLGVGETVGGSMRIWDYAELIAAYKANSLDPSPYYWYTDQRRFGSVPHGGFGLGLERMLMWLMNLDHVKECTLYPRLMGRCKP